MVLFHLQTAKKQKKKKPKKTDSEFNAKFSFTDQVVFSHLSEYCISHNYVALILVVFFRQIHVYRNVFQRKYM